MEKLSNSYILENNYSWKGIISEPNRHFHASISGNRKCTFDKRCIYGTSGEYQEFCESEVGDLSTLSCFAQTDLHSKFRENSYKLYDVETVTLLDLLKEHHAPNEIDYLSIDTEGSEFLILEQFDFSQFLLEIITVEHNFNENREKIYNRLTRHGYVRSHLDLSKCDDWYIHGSLVN